MDLREGVTLVVGLGNPILGDDGVGWRVAERVAALLPAALADAVEVECFALGGLSLMERMVGYRRAIVIDAITTGAPDGQVRALGLEDLDGPPAAAWAHATAVHDTSLGNALRLGREMGAALPDSVDLVGVEASSLYEFSEELTPVVAAAVPIAAGEVLAMLGVAPGRGRPDTGGQHGLA
jgi:hydrogenase maturation protease